MYLEKLQEGKFTESVVFTKEVLNKFISSLDNDDLLARLAEGEKTNVFDIEVPDDVIASTRNTQERISAMRSVLFRTGFCYRVFSSDVLYLEEYIKELITEGNTDPKDWVEFYVMAKDLLPRIEKVAKEGLGMKKAEFFLREIGPLIGCLRESNPGLSQKLEIYANKLMSRLDSLLQCENIEKTYSEIDLDADDLVNYIKALLESKAIPEIRRIEQFL